MPSPNRNTTGTPLILVVEDDHGVRQFIAESLRGAGLEVLEAADGVQGLTLWREHAGAIALAIIDVGLPAMNGLDLAAELEHTPPSAVVLFTSGDDSSIAIKGISQRFPDRVLTKPFTERELLGRVTALL